MERKKRYRLHKGKLRTKFRYPRKEKKRLHKKWQKEFEVYYNRLVSLHGDKWYDYFICGG